MRRIAIAIAILVGFGASAAQAQPRLISDAPETGVSPGEALALVRSTGLRPVSPPTREGPYYVVHAMDPYGDTKRVMVDAEVGDVIRVRPVEARRYGWYRRTPPGLGGGPRLWRDEADYIGPPPASVGRPLRPPPPRIVVEDEDDLPPPRGVTQGAVSERPSAGLPPPPDPIRRAPPPAVAPAAPRTAAITPTAPPLPREKPTVQAPRQASAPRVILPGGPEAKGETKAESKTEVTGSIPAASPSHAPALKPAPGMPPVNPLE